MPYRKIARDTVEKTLVDGESVTATGVIGDVVTAQNIKTALWFLTIEDWATMTTLDIKLQTQDPKTSAWFDLGIQFAQASGNTSEMKNSLHATSYFPIPLGKNMRAYATVAGGGSATVTLYMVGKT